MEQKRSTHELLEQIVLVVAINYAFIIAMSSAYVYQITSNAGGNTVEVSGTASYETGMDWKACETKCRAHAECQSFHFDGNWCNLFQTALKYGSLYYDGVISGQLESTAPDAALAWAGIGKIGRRPSRLMRRTEGGTPWTHAECQVHCNELGKVHKFPECVSYELYTDGDEFCWQFVNLFSIKSVRTEQGYAAGVRVDVNVSDVEIFGDVINSRVAPEDFPSAPPDIGGAVPSFTETNFHFAGGLADGWTKFTTANVAQWEDCSVECHRNDACMSFMFFDGPTQECHFYDAAIIGTVTPGKDKYGIIDRSKEEGAVLSLVDFDKMQKSDNSIVGRLIMTWSSNSQDDCAKLCYNFYQPVLCFSFFYDLNEGKCYLHDSLPFVWPLGEKSTAFRNNIWNATLYRLAYFEERLPPELKLIMNSMTTTTTRSFCTVRESKTTLFSVAQIGARIISPPGIVTNNVRSRSLCANLCHCNPVCRSFSFSQSRKECHQHCVPSTDPDVIFATDPEFIISSLYGKQANAAYKYQAPSTTAATVLNLEGCLKAVPSGCASPFTFGGLTYSGCTTAGFNGVCWCATATIYDGGWKYCPAVNLEGCSITVPSGCASPFTYGGLTYNSGCTTAGFNGVCWCPTATIYDGGWKYC